MRRGIGVTAEVLVATLVTLAVVAGGAVVWWLRPGHAVPHEKAETLQWSGRFAPTMAGHWAKLVFDGYTDSGNPQVVTRDPVHVTVSVAAGTQVQVMVLSAGYPVHPRIAPADADGVAEFVITPADDACLVPVLVYVRGVTPTAVLTSASAAVSYSPVLHGRPCPAADEPTG